MKKMKADTIIGFASLYGSLRNSMVLMILYIVYIYFQFAFAKNKTLV